MKRQAKNELDEFQDEVGVASNLYQFQSYNRL